MGSSVGRAHAVRDVSPPSPAAAGPRDDPGAEAGSGEAATDRRELAPDPRGVDEAVRLGALPVASQPAVEAAGSQVFSSYYGPGLYGRGTACGLILTTDLLGVAHRTLPCGAPVTLRHGAMTVTVPVVDRGPYVLAREFDLTYATKVALGCPDLCRVAWLR